MRSMEGTIQAVRLAAHAASSSSQPNPTKSMYSPTHLERLVAYLLHVGNVLVHVQLRRTVTMTGEI